MYGQSFPIFSHSIKCALGMPRLDSHLSSFASKVQALTQAELATISTTLFDAQRVFLSYISIIGFSKPAQIVVTFLTYSFYFSTHHTEIQQSTARLIHDILTSQQFNIDQLILDTLTSYHDYSFLLSDLPFVFLVSCILEDVSFEIGNAKSALLDESSQAKHYSHVYGLMALLDPHGPQDATTTQQATQEAITIEENKI